MSLCKLAIVCLGGLWFLAGCAAEPDDGSRYRIKDQGKWGFITFAGRVVIPPTFDDNSYQFSEGLAPVKVGKKWGYIDRAGTMVISPRFDGAQSFQCGLAAVLMGKPFKGEGNWGQIDKTGRFVLRPDECYSFGEFSSGLMPVKLNDKWGYVNRQGTLAIPAQFKYASGFSEGLAWVTGEQANGFIDPMGNMVIRLKTTVDGDAGFHEGLAAIRDEKTSKLGYINKQGQWAITPQFDDANDFVDGLAAVCVAKNDETGWPVRKWGFIDKAGRIVIPLQFNHAGSFAEGLAKVELNKKWGFVDRQGKQVISCQFDSVEPFWNGLAWVNVGGYGQEGWHGYINRTGQFVWRPSNYRQLDEARLAKESRQPTIHVFTDPHRTGKGLQIGWPRKVSTKGLKAGQFPITIVNLLEEEIFLQVSGFDSLGGWFESPDGWPVSHGHIGVFFPDNTGLLKRLHASTWHDGKSLTCGCAVAWINGTLTPELLAAGRIKGHVRVFLKGFYRNTGKDFGESVELPVEIVDQAIADDQPATKPSTAPAIRP